MLKISNVSKICKNFALRDISVEIPKGYITGLIGPNGAGKSTLMRLILDVESCDTGTITLDGIDHTKQGIEFRNQVGFVFENEKTFLKHRTAIENGKILGKLYSNWSQELFENYLKQFHLTRNEQMKLPIHKLSKGQYMRFQLAFALAHKPKLLILDEPTANLDPVFRTQFLQVLQEAIEGEEVAVLFATHITTDLDKIGDYLIVLDQGMMKAYGTKEELYDIYQVKKVSDVLLQVMRREDA